MSAAHELAQAQLQQNMGAMNAAPDPLTDLKSSFADLSPDDLTDFGTSLAAGQITRAESAKGKDARAQLYETLRNSNDSLSKKRSELIQKMAADQPLSKGETAAMLFIGLLPSLIGKAVGGNRGGAAGAQAGALGTQVMAKGMADDQQRKRLQAQGELEAVTDELKSNKELQSKAVLDEINAQDTAKRDASRDATTLQAASIRAGGDRSVAASLKEIGMGLTNEKKQQDVDEGKREAEAATLTFDLGGGKQAVNTGKVDAKTAAKVKEDEALYNTAVKKLQNAIDVGKSMQYGAASRVSGSPASKDMKRAYTQAKNAFIALNKIPGLKDSQTYKELEDILNNPTGLISNAKGALPWTESVERGLQQFQQEIQETRESDLKNAGYEIFVPGAVKYNKRTNQYEKVIGLAPDGSGYITEVVK